MSLLEACYRFGMEQQLFSCQRIIVGVSAGADSLCLLDILYHLKKQDRTGNFPEICAAYFNHKLRSQARDEADLVKDYCVARGLLYFYAEKDIAALAQDQGWSLEEAGRKARYDFFQHLADEHADQVIFIAVAHHAEDQAETLLLNLLRGSGLDGLCGMLPKHNNLIRPLLFADKSQIYAYLKQADLSFLEDETNKSNDFRRNRIRNQVIPLLKDVSGTDIVKQLAQTSTLLQADREYLEYETKLQLDRFLQLDFQQEWVLSWNAFIDLPLAMLRRVVRLYYSQKFNHRQNLGAVHVQAIIELAKQGRRGSRINLPDERVAYLKNSGLLILAERELKESDKRHCWWTNNGKVYLLAAPLEEPILFDLPSDFEEYCINFPKSPFQLKVISVENLNKVVYNRQMWYCSPKLLQEVELRTRRSGDWLKNPSGGHKKLLRRYLTDCKIPADVRDRILLLAKGDEILWIPGLISSSLPEEMLSEPYEGVPVDVRDECPFGSRITDSRNSAPKLIKLYFLE